MRLDNYVVLDLETTGLDPKKDKIIEMGAVRIRDGNIVDSMKSYVNQGKKIPENVSALTGIKNEQLSGAPEYKDIIPTLLEFLGEDVLIGHSILFDYSFFKRAAVNMGLDYNPKAIDTLKIARKYLPLLESRSLPYLCKYYKLDYISHRALEDATATAMLYQRLCQDFDSFEREKEDEVFQPKYLVYQVKRESPIREHQKQKLEELYKQHNIIPDYDLDTLTRNEASRFIDQILATYGR